MCTTSSKDDVFKIHDHSFDKLERGMFFALT